MTYAQAVEHLFALAPELAPARSSSGSPKPSSTLHKFDLAHMRALCAALGNPQDRVPSVLIAGTNGKGSTAATLASILTAAGYRTGLYTSPHLARVNERIQIASPVEPSEYGNVSVHNGNGPLVLVPIPDADFARLYSSVDETAERLVRQGDLPHLPSFFERLTAMAFLFFAGDAGTPAADIMVLEVGLGGRLDATNIVEPLISVITDIALDHQAYLGNTIGEIAREKAGILRHDGVLVTLAQHPEANQAIGEVALSLELTAIDAAQYLPPAARNSGIGRSGKHDASLIPRNRYTLRMEDAADPGEIHVDSPLRGEHQRRNIALAIAAAVCLRNRKSYSLHGVSSNVSYTIPNGALQQGIRDTQWPGRLEFIAPNLLLDVAHNPAGAWTLRAALGVLPQETPRTLLFSCLADKKLDELAQILFPLFDSGGTDPLRAHDHILFAPIANPRAATVDAMLACAAELGIPATAVPDAQAGLREAERLTPANGIIVATGSIYFVGEIRRLVFYKEAIAESHAG